MGKTSAKIKSDWNAKKYDCLGVRLPKGSVPEIKELARGRGMSQAQFIRLAILQACTEEERAELQALIKEPENYKNGYISAFLGGGGVTPRKKTARSRKKCLYSDDSTGASRGGGGLL